MIYGPFEAEAGSRNTDGCACLLRPSCLLVLLVLLLLLFLIKQRNISQHVAIAVQLQIRHTNTHIDYKLC